MQQGRDELLGQQVAEIFRDGIQEQAFPGGAVRIEMNGQTLLSAGFGRLAPCPGDDEFGQAVTSKTIYDLASLTKVLAMTSAIMLLVERGAIEIDLPLVDYLPEFERESRPKRAVTIEHLLTHTSGLAATRELYRHYQGREAIVEAVCREELLHVPGERYLYSDLGCILLGEVIQRITSEDLAAFTARTLFQPLGMTDTYFNPPAALLERIAPTEYDKQQLIRGVVHDENARAMGGIAGHAGLFSTIDDLAIFCTMLLQNGSYGTVSMFRPETVEMMCRLYLTTPDGASALGWLLDAPWFMGKLASRTTIGHTGFTGTSLVIDRERGLSVILLTNRVCPTRHGPNINPYRRRLADAVQETMTGKQ